MSLDQQRKLVRCSVNPEVLSAAGVYLVLPLTSQVQCSKPDDDGSGEAEAKVKFSTEIDALLVIKKCTV